MSEVLSILKTVFQQTNQYIHQRTSLDLPTYNDNFPFRHNQCEALELILSNAPLVAISGITGSGKTEVAKAAVNLAIAHQRSALITAPFPSTFDAYKNLRLPPLTITLNQNYRQLLKLWLREQFSNPKLTFLPSYLLEDQLFEDIFTKRDHQFWLQLFELEQGHPKELQKKVAVIIEDLLPTISSHRQKLLVYKICKSQDLLKHREQLYQNYTNLSDNALDQITDALLPSSQAPLLCQVDHLSNLDTYSKELSFDLVIVEDSHYVNDRELQNIAMLSKKLVLLGDRSNKRTLFAKLWSNLLPAYRYELNDNYRIHPELARYILPAIYPQHSFIYTPIKKQSCFIPQGNTRLTWINIKQSTQFAEILQSILGNQDLQTKLGELPTLLTFSQEIIPIIQNLLCGMNRDSQISVSHVDDWHGQECQNLWIFLEQSEAKSIVQSKIRLALTRAINQITFFGDREYFKEQQIFQDIIPKCRVIRELAINREG